MIAVSSFEFCTKSDNEGYLWYLAINWDSLQQQNKSAIEGPHLVHIGIPTPPDKLFAQLAVNIVKKKVY